MVKQQLNNKQSGTWPEPIRIGLNKTHLLYTGYFKYDSNNKIVPSAFHNWAVSDPNQWGIQGEYFVKVQKRYSWLNVTTSGVWNDQYGDIKQYFLCEQVQKGN